MEKKNLKKVLLVALVILVCLVCLYLIAYHQLMVNGKEYKQSISEENFEDITYIKLFIELAFKEWIKSDKRYDFTKKVNQLFRNFYFQLRS